MSKKIKELIKKIKAQDYKPYFPDAVGGNEQEEAEPFVFRVLENYAEHLVYESGYLKLSLRDADYKRACFLRDAIIKVGRDSGLLIVFNDKFAEICNVKENEMGFQIVW